MAMMPRRFEHKIFLGIIVIFVLFVPILLTAIYSLKKITTVNNKTIADYADELILAEQLNSLMGTQFIQMPHIVNTGEAEPIAQFAQTRVKFRQVLTRLTDMSTDLTDLRFLTEISTTEAEMYVIAQRAIALRKSGMAPKALEKFIADESRGKPRFIAKTLNEYVDTKTIALSRAQERDEATTNHIIESVLLTTLLALFFAAIISYLMIKAVLQKKQQDNLASYQLEQEMRISRARKDAVEVVAHDLRNPLSAIKLGVHSALATLSKIPADSATASDRLHKVLRSSESMERLIRNLLDHTKIESGNLVLEKKPCNIDDFLMNLLPQFETLTRAKSLRLNLDIEDHLPQFMCDHALVEQALSNLIGNALKFTPADGTIEISVKKKGAGMIFSVSDTGPGIAREDLSHIFERYWQSREAAKLGTGLGLSIVSGVARAHGGNVSVESDLGRGSKFSFYIPLEPAPVMQPANNLRV